MRGDWHDRAAYCLLCGGALIERQLFGLARKACTQCEFILFRNPATAAATVVAVGREILMIRRGIDPYRGAWGFPGGFQDWGETTEQAAVRETREETGLEVELERILAVEYTRDDPRKQANVVVYLARPADGALAGSLRPADDAVDAGFFSLDDLPADIAFENNRTILGRLQAQFPTGDIR